MFINGEKFACEACVRGHRVSSCHHSDRPLVHVNKKGRPVSQCHHCRGLRKARSQHVKCECQDKSHTEKDCPHLRPDIKKEPNTCCCGHGTRCTCSLKKEHLDTVHEDTPPHIQPKDPQKPRITSMNSHDSKTTIFQNGHHKPVHKLNDAHNHVGAPYRIPSRSNSLHGHRELAQRSAENLPLKSVSNTKPHQESPLHHSISTTTQPVRQVKSEHNSPVIGPLTTATGLHDFAIPPLDPNAYSYSPFGNESPVPGNNPQLEHQASLPEQFPDSWFMTYDEAHEYVPPAVYEGMHDAPVVDWSTYNFEQSGTSSPYGEALTNNPMYLQGQAPPYAPTDYINHFSQAGLTSSSGEISEVEDHISNTRPSTFRSASHDASNDMSSIGDDASDAYRLSTASSGWAPQQLNMLATTNVDELSKDFPVGSVEVGTQNLKHSNQSQQQQQQFQQMVQMQMQQMQRNIIQQKQQQEQHEALAREMESLSHDTPPLQQPQQQQSQYIESQQDHKNSVASTNSEAWNLSPGGEHPFTLHEAQTFAHMGDNRSQQTQTPGVNLTEDPMWSTAQEVSQTLTIEDDRQEDEMWGR